MVSVIFIVVLYLMVTEDGLVAVAEEPDVLVYVMVAVGVHPSAVHVNVIFGVIAVAAVASVALLGLVAVGDGGKELLCYSTTDG